MGGINSLTALMQDPAVIAATRRQLGLTQSDLARAAGVSGPLVNQIERRTKRVTEQTAERFVAAFLERDRELRHYQRPPFLVEFETRAYAAIGVRQ